MPQSLAKCRRPLNDPASIPITGDKAQENVRIPQKNIKLRWIRNRNKNGFVPVAWTAPAQAPQDEDWEKEIEESLCRTKEEKEKDPKDQMPYDAKGRLNMPLVEMRTYTVPSAPNPKREHYIPSAHHVLPVVWTHHVYSVVKGQFADAEE